MAKENQISLDIFLKEGNERKKIQEKRFKLTKEHVDRVRHIEGFPMRQLKKL